MVPRDTPRDVSPRKLGAVLIGINPVLLSLGPLAVRWSGLLALVGLAVAIWASLRELDRQQLGRKLALDALAWALPAGLLSARAVYLLGHWDYYLTNSAELWQLSPDGLSLWGGLVGGGLIAAARLRRDPYRRRRVLDAVVPYVALGIVIGRLGEFLGGDGQGLPSSLPWATQYSSPLAATPDFGVARHPAQVYDAILALALFGVLLCVPRTAPVGTRLGLFLVAYGLGRFALGVVRLDPAFLLGLQIEQLLALAMAAAGVVYGIRPLLAKAGDRARALQPSRARQTQAKEDSLAA